MKAWRSTVLVVSAVSLAALSDSSSLSESKPFRKRVDRVPVIKSKKTLYLLKGDEVITSKPSRWRTLLFENDILYISFNQLTTGRAGGMKKAPRRGR